MINAILQNCKYQRDVVVQHAKLLPRSVIIYWSVGYDVAVVILII